MACHGENIMTVKDINPFSQNRFEHENKHLYYLPKEIYSKIEQPKPIYLVGTRGTGKTTLLKSMSWDERATNIFLKRELDNKVFEKRYLGIYIKFASTVTNFFDLLMKKTDDNQLDELFSLYLDLIWVELLLESIADIIVDDEINLFVISPKDEQSFVRNVFVAYDLFEPYAENGPKTIRELSMLVKKIRKQLDLDVKLSKDLKCLFRDYRPEACGKFGRDIGRKLGLFCDNHSVKEGESWHFKVLVDEAEWFSLRQEKIINTMVRLSEHPVYFVISYVRDRDEDGELVATTNPAISLSDADRELIFIDQEFEKIKSFYDGVSTVRIRALLNKPDISFALSSVLGNLDINSLIEKVLKESTKKGIYEKWCGSAKRLKESNLWKSSRIDSGNEMLFYQAYVYEKMGSKPEEEWSEGLEDSIRAQIRKKIVAAYLCLCKEIGRRDVIYAYSNMVFQMSDGCIRDYLLQLSEIYAGSGRKLESFVNATSFIPVKKQSEAILRASENKYNNIYKSRLGNPHAIANLLYGLGVITSELQSSDDAMRTPEKGQFEVEFRKDDEDEMKMLKYINETSEAGYIKIIEVNGDKRVFRLHSLLAPKFKFSYRGAYNKITGLDCAAMYELINCKDETQLSGVAKRIAEELVNPKQAMDAEQDTTIESNLNTEKRTLFDDLGEDHESI